MTENEFLFQFRKLRRLITEAKDLQDRRGYSHDNYAHANAKLSEAESIALDLQREYEIQAGQKAVVSQS
jgi:hypothetical protein